MGPGVSFPSPSDQCIGSRSLRSLGRGRLNGSVEGSHYLEKTIKKRKASFVQNSVQTNSYKSLLLTQAWHLHSHHLIVHCDMCPWVQNLHQFLVVPFQLLPVIRHYSTAQHPSGTDCGQDGKHQDHNWGCSGAADNATGCWYFSRCTWLHFGMGHPRT